MPQRKQYRKRRSKLADKKINTLVEKRIKEIAKDEDDKNIRWYVQYAYVGSGSSNPLPQIPSIATTQQLDPNVSTPGTVDNNCYIRCLTAFGNNYEQDISNIAGSGADNKSMEYKVSQVQAFLRFRNQNAINHKVCAALVYIPNADYYTARTAPNNDALLPSLVMISKNNAKFAPDSAGIFNKRLQGFYDYLPSKYTILDRKTINLPAPYATGLVEENSTTWRDMSLTFRYKNLKKFQYVKASADNTTSQRMNNGNIYLVIAHDQTINNAPGATSGIYAYGVAGCKMSIGENMKLIGSATV